MSTIENEGVVESPVSHENSKYDEYYELNKDDGDGLGSPESKSEVKSEEKPELKQVDNSQKTEDTTKAEDRSPKPEREPHYMKSIKKLTAQKKQLEEQLKAITESRSKQTPDYTRDNFIDDKEYQTWLKDKIKKETMEELTMKQLAERTQSIEAEQSEYENEAFRQTWTERVRNCYSSQDPKELQDFTRIASDERFINNLPDVVHDYLEGSDLGPVMMHVLYLRPDKVAEIANARPINQTKLLMRLESDIENYAKQQPVQQQQKPAVSRAPKPIGSVGVSGQSMDDSENDEAEYASYLRKKFGR